MNTESLMYISQIIEFSQRLIHELYPASCRVVMKTNRTERFEMMRGALMELPVARPLEVASASGTLWLTLDNDPRDLVLGQGECILLDTSKRVLVYALDDAQMEIRKVVTQ
jgi:hypothetical protein